MLSEMLTMTVSPRSTHRSANTAQIHRSIENSQSRKISPSPVPIHASKHANPKPTPNPNAGFIAHRQHRARNATLTQNNFNDIL
jgi:hypothetical protein